MNGPNASREFAAQMSARDGRWRLYVALLNTTERWPDHRFGRMVPTFTERTDALSALGFEPVPGAAWEWTEDSETPDNPASPVILIATIRVRSWSAVSV